MRTPTSVIAIDLRQLALAAAAAFGLSFAACTGVLLAVVSN